MAVGTVEAESGVAGVPQRHGRAHLAVLIEEVKTGSAVRSEIESHSVRPPGS